MTQIGVTYKPGDIVSACYNFKRVKPEDLSFTRNEELQILDIAKDPNWAHATNSSGETGLIPLNYVLPSVTNSRSLRSQRWYHGRISRMESEKLLSGHPPGSFLVRDSDLFSGDLTLCVVGPSHDNLTSQIDRRANVPETGAPSTNIQHYHILCKTVKPLLAHAPQSVNITTRYSLDEIDWFTNLPDLLQYYSVPDSGLVASLKHPVPDVQRQRLNQLRELGWMICRKDLSLGDQIGRGEFGEVLRATYRNSDVAVKMYKKTACKLAITYEAMLMTKLDHPNLVAFVGFVYEPEDDAVYLVTEYLPLGNLLTYLHSRTRDEVTERDKLQFSLDACRGLAYLEERRIVHRDVAARNILLSGQPPHLIAKVADFGMARDLHHNCNSSPPLGVRPPTSAPPGLFDDANLLSFNNSDQPTSSSEVVCRFDSDPDLSPNMRDMGLHETAAAVPIKWTAPEAVQKRLFTNKSDVWSFGILMWEIYSFGRIPYPRMMANQALRQIMAGYRMKAPEGCPSDIYQLMRRTWCIDPDERPSFANLLQELTVCLHRLISGTRVRRPLSLTRRSAEPTLKLSGLDLGRNKWGNRNSYTERQNTLSSDGNYDHVDDLFQAPSLVTPRSPRNPVIAPHHNKCVVATTSSMSRSFTLTGPTSEVRPSTLSGTTEQCANKSFCLPKFERIKHS